MNSRYFFTPELVCNSGFAVAISSISPLEDRMTVPSSRNRSSSSSSRVPPPGSSFLIRLAIKISRARWFSFLRRVFHYQNGPRSDLVGSSNPFNSTTWMMTELVVLIVQIAMVSYTLAISKTERPVWPMRLWISGYALGCTLSLMLLCWRYHTFPSSQPDASIPTVSDLEHQRNHGDESR